MIENQLEYKELQHRIVTHAQTIDHFTEQMKVLRIDIMQTKTRLTALVNGEIQLEDQLHTLLENIVINLKLIDEKLYDGRIDLAKEIIFSLQTQIEHLMEKKNEPN